MKKLTVKELEKLTEDLSNWEVGDDYQILDYTDRPIEELGIDATEVFGCVSRTHKHSSGITITYSEYFTYLENEPDTYNSTSDGVDDYLLLDGCVIVDEDGDELEAWDIQHYIPTSFMEVPDLSDLADPEIDLISVDDSLHWLGERLEIRRSYQPSLVCFGKKIADGETSPDSSSCYYSGRNWRWDRLELYKTTDNFYVASRVKHSLLQGSKDLHTAKACKTLNEVRDFFADEFNGHGYDAVVECVLSGASS